MPVGFPQTLTGSSLCLSISLAEAIVSVGLWQQGIGRKIKNNESLHQSTFSDEKGLISHTLGHGDFIVH